MCSEDFVQSEENLINTVQDDLLKIFKDAKKDYDGCVVSKYTEYRRGRLEMIKEICIKFGFNKKFLNDK